ncbi:cytoskeletal protein RodZ [Bacillus mesophilus]|uniref:Helix-turn-helix domain-containing protein n=1 Tax=Bacillus mesophilus TaxID=1808955 RepID=A0A6M0Q1W3_9BACI|nr:RodZ domain-containing protein [Bacillus mesophilus]MBM7659290.1 cytoskeletal protein RodZ [Bacillus mesophilus]NEY70164.1 helix-turn-helix domain-containing protein [Bacillus mesophilus]
MTELGQHLKRAREERNITLEELQLITKIQRRYLQNVEEGNFDALPGIFYARAFVKQYAEAVGLDSEQVFEEFKNELPSAKKEAIPEQLSRVKRARAEVNTKDSKFLQLFPKILVTVIVIGIAFTVWKVSQTDPPADQVEEKPETETGAEVEENTKNPLQTGNTDSEEEETVTEEEETTEVEEEVVEPVQQFELVESSGRSFTYKLSNTNQFIVEVSTTGETWLDLRNGKNKKFFSGMLNTKADDQAPDRTTYDYTNETEAFVKLGKAMDSVLMINGQKVELPAEPKDVQEITIIFEKSAE